MEYKATVSTQWTTGQVESDNKQEVQDFVMAWVYELNIDLKVHREHPELEPKNTYIWRKGNSSITTNFNIK